MSAGDLIGSVLLDSIGVRLHVHEDSDGGLVIRYYTSVHASVSVAIALTAAAAAELAALLTRAEASDG